MLCGLGSDQPDEVPWCSSFVNAICWLLRLPRSKSAAARSWLGIGVAVNVFHARPGDIIVLARGAPPSGHVGFYAGFDPVAQTVEVLGGNQSDAVSIAKFKMADVLGVRRVA